MGIELVEEVLEHAPDDLGAAEMLTLFVIAKDANDVTRRGWPGDLLTRGTRMKARTVRDAITVLVDRGLVVRIPLKMDRHGQPVYAFRGRSAVFEIPRLIHRRAKGGGPPPPSGPEKGGGIRQKGGGIRQKGGGPPPPSPQFSDLSSSSDARARDLVDVIEAVENRTGTRINHDHAARVVAQIVGDRGVRFPVRYAVTAIDRDPNPHRFLPTPIPPPFRRPPDPTTNGRDHP